MKVSIVTPSFNQGDFIERTIKSVLSQSYNDIEYIIIDGGSKDSTLDICKKYEKEIDLIISEPDNGQTDAINKGFRLATGDVVGWINSDDILYKDCVEEIVGIFNSNNNCSIAYPENLDFIDENDNIFRKINKKIKNKDHLLNCDFSVIQQGSFYRKKDLELIGFLDEKINFCMDLDLWLRLLSCGDICGYGKKPLSAFRIWGGTKTSNGGNKFIRDIRKTLLRHGASVFSRNMAKLKFWEIKNSIKKVLS